MSMHRERNDCSDIDGDRHGNATGVGMGMEMGMEMGMGMGMEIGMEMEMEMEADMGMGMGLRRPQHMRLHQAWPQCRAALSDAFQSRRHHLVLLSSIIGRVVIHSSHENLLL